MIIFIIIKTGEATEISSHTESTLGEYSEVTKVVCISIIESVISVKGLDFQKSDKANSNLLNRKSNLKKKRVVLKDRVHLGYT